MSGGIVRTVLAILLAFVAGSILIIVTNPDVIAASAYFFSRPADTLSAAWDAVVNAYSALFRGSIYNYNADSFQVAIRPLTETLRFSGPLIAAGLGIAISFRAGMFNIGGSGQLLMAAAFASWASFQLDLPYGIHLVVAILFGLFGGAMWASIVGFLKAQTGAHEVIVTIMLNYIAASLITFLMRTPILHGDIESSNPTTVPPLPTAQLPGILGSGFDLHLGFILALIAVVVYWWLMERSTVGFRLRAVGLNPDAARASGINVKRVYVVAMVLSGLFVGLAGVNQALGRSGGFTPSIDSGIGFDAITVALLGGSSAGGVLLAGLLFGAMKAGGPAMQVADVAPEVLVVIQSLIVLFVAAPPLIRAIFRLPKPRRVDTPRAKARTELQQAEKGSI
jgi:simple sugar transport system permease protein